MAIVLRTIAIAVVAKKSIEYCNTPEKHCYREDAPSYERNSCF